MKRYILVFLLLFMATGGSLFGQTAQTNVTGTIIDPNSVPYFPATVTACLIPVTVDPVVDNVHVNSNPGANYCIGPVPTSNVGSFSMALFPNSKISSSSGLTQWQFNVDAAGSAPPAGKGAQHFQSIIAIAAAPAQDIGSTLSAAAPILLNSGSGGGGGFFPDITDIAGVVTITATTIVNGALTISGPGPNAFNMTEGAAASCPNATAGHDILCANNSPHGVYLSTNGSTYVPIGQGTPAPPNNSVQVDNSGALGGSAFLYNPTDNTGNVCQPGSTCASLSTNADSGILLNSTDGLSNINIVAQNGTATNSVGAFIAVGGTVTNPNAQAFTFTAVPTIGGNTTGGACFGSPSDPPCANGYFSQPSDTRGDASNGQDLVGFSTEPVVEKASGTVRTIADFVALPMVGFNTNPIAETSTNSYGVMVMDQGGISTTEQSAVKIQAQTTPASGAKYSIKCDTGCGTASFSDAVIITGSTYTLGPSTPGTHWTDKLVTAYSSAQCASGCQIIVPDSIADDGSATTPTLAQGVSLYFPGSATFGFCNLNLGHGYNIRGSGNALLRQNLNGCTGITETQADQMASGFRDVIDRINVDCNGHTNSTGFTLLASGGNASVDMENSTARNCTLWGLSLNSQFGTFRGLTFFNNAADCNCSGSSNTFYDIKSVGTSQVGIYILDGQGQIFVNPQIQNKTVAGMAVDFDGTGAQTHVIIYGGSPELNGGGAASTTIGGRTINQAGSLFVNASVVDWYSNSTQDASTSPDILVQGGGSVNLHDTRGTLAVGGYFCQAGDLNSYCNYYGTLQASGMNNGVGNWPSALQASQSNVNNGLDLIGQPLFIINSGVPNLYNGNPMTPPLGFCGAGVTCSTAVDPLFGTVSTVAYAASVGSQCSANCAAIANMITTPLAAANDIQMSFYVKASTSTLIKFYCGGSHFCGPNNGFTVTPNWQRLMIYMPNQVSSTNVFMQMTALDSAGATLSITGLQVNQCAAQTAACIEQMGTVTSTGAVNPLGFNGFTSAFEQIQGTKFTATGCTNGTTLGGATGGSLLTGASGACTLTITMGAGTLPATNAWTCSASDQTTAAGNPIFQNGGSTTTATLSLPAGNVSGDKISFSCRSF